MSNRRRVRSRVELERPPVCPIHDVGLVLVDLDGLPPGLVRSAPRAAAAVSAVSR
jgi:hypothetical protein